MWNVRARLSRAFGAEGLKNSCTSFGRPYILCAYAHEIYLIFFGLLNANGSTGRDTFPLKALSPTPLHYPL